jgi:hypothetical protein
MPANGAQPTPPESTRLCRSQRHLAWDRDRSTTTYALYGTAIMTPGQSPYDYTQGTLSELRRTMSEDRFATYLNRCNGNVRLACEQYTWNTAMSAAFYGPLQAFEVTLRNAVNEALITPFTSWWFRDDQLIKVTDLEKVESSYRELDKKQSGPPSPGQVVADLPLSFWTAMFTDKYEKSLWVPHLRHLFPKKTDRKDLWGDLDKVRTLRNRIAHHEHIIKRNAAKDLARIQRLTEPLSSEVWEWVVHHCRVGTLRSQGTGQVVAF